MPHEADVEVSSDAADTYTATTRVCDEHRVRKQGDAQDCLE